MYNSGQKVLVRLADGKVKKAVVLEYVPDLYTHTHTHTHLVAVLIGKSEKVISEKIFGDLTDHARRLFVAHNLTLQAQNVSTSSAGGMPGFNGGITASKSVGSASISYDTGSSAEDGGGSYNLTIYGKQLYRLMKTFGAGCIQI